MTVRKCDDLIGVIHDLAESIQVICKESQIFTREDSGGSGRMLLDNENLFQSREY
jgi:hypothetical protein